MSTTISPAETRVAVQSGGGFILEDVVAAEVFTPEDFTEEHRQIQATAARFLDEEVLPQVEALENKEDDLSRRLVEKAAELGLCSILVPEKYDGLELGLTAQLIVAEQMGRYASFSTTYGAQVGIGLLPLVFFGNEEQKKRYLPKLISGEWMAAYCLSEAQAGSDALAARTRAELSPDGKHYILNGEKMWISNGGWADLYTIFAKVDGEKFSTFLVERQMEGVKPGAEEHKMGIRGSSTTPVVLEDVHVPVENVLGEIGRGHIIAFNILNLGRMKLCVSCSGGSKDVLAETIRYAKQRKAFGRAIAEFGLMQHKMAEMAIRIFAAESMAYRISGMVDEQLADHSWDDEDAAKTVLETVEERAIECAMAKVYGSEALDYVVDEGVQVHGGYGFHQDYMVERAYRDSRVNRIFEGTNEINRLLVTGMLLKRAAAGRLDLLSAVKQVQAEVEAGNFGADAGAGEGPLAEQRALVRQAKKVTLLTLGVAYQRFGEKLEEEQEVMAAISDMLIDTYAAESALLRAEKLVSLGRGEQAADMVRVLAGETIAGLRHHAAAVSAASSEGPALEMQMKILHRLTRFTPVNGIALRRGIAERLIEAEKFIV